MDDPRGYEKFALSLTHDHKYKVHLTGPPALTNIENPEITTTTIKLKAGRNLNRFFQPWRFWPVLIKVKPKLIIFNSHDLLWVMVLFRIIFGTKLIYDVQENYYRNIRYQKHHSKTTSYLLSAYVRLKEKLTAPFISHFILAEQGYQDELTFPGDRTTVLENKYVPLQKLERRSPHGTIRLLLTGTISYDYGVFAAIQLAAGLAEFVPDIELVIMGHCAHEPTRRTIESNCEGISCIDLRLSDNPIPHQEIISSMHESDWLLLPYLPNKSTENCIPAKLYEALALKLPVIISDHLLWSAMVQEANAGEVLNYESPEAVERLRELVNTPKQYYDSPSQINPFWSSEEHNFIDLIDSEVV